MTPDSSTPFALYLEAVLTFSGDPKLLHRAAKKLQELDQLEAAYAKVTWRDLLFNLTHRSL